MITKSIYGNIPYDNVEIATSRCGMYGFLSRIYQQPPDKELLRVLGEPQLRQAMEEIGIRPPKRSDDAVEKEILADMQTEFTRLFVGPGPHLSPHESVYHPEDSGQLWGESTVAVKQFIEACGFSYLADSKYIPDHISIELAFMHAVTAAEVCALIQDTDVCPIKYINIESRFIQDHLIQWIPIFSEKIMELTESRFYNDMACLTRDFINLENTEIKELRQDVCV